MMTEYCVTIETKNGGQAAVNVEAKDTGEAKAKGLVVLRDLGLISSVHQVENVEVTYA